MYLVKYRANSNHVYMSLPLTLVLYHRQPVIMKGTIRNLPDQEVMHASEGEQEYLKHLR